LTPLSDVEAADTPDTPLIAYFKGKLNL